MFVFTLEGTFVYVSGTEAAHSNFEPVHQVKNQVLMVKSFSNKDLNGKNLEMKNLEKTF